MWIRSVRTMRSVTPLRQRVLRAVASIGAVALVTTGAVAVAPAITAGAATTSLPFDLVTGSSASRLVFAHYFTPYPVSLDNGNPTTDYYARNYLQPNGEGGAHAAYGGLLRDRPVPHAARTESNWLTLNIEDEIRQAKSIGIDGFSLDLMVTPTSTNTNVRLAQANVMTAADNVGGFKIMMMPDVSGGLVSLTAAQLASLVATYGSHSSAFRLSDGRLVVSPFKAEAHNAAWWGSFMSAMETTYNMPVALVPLFVGDINTYASSFAPISYGMSVWGSRTPAWNDPNATGSTSAIGHATLVHSLGKIWMQPASVQDERPNQSIYDEALNTTNLRNTWQIARDSKAEWVQAVTWNDYSEGAHIAPSVERGWAYTDLTAYYAQWYRTGTAPAIVRDAVFLTHRDQPAAATPSFPETKLMKWRGGSPARDLVESVSLLTAPATVTLTVAGVSTSCSAPAGVSVCTAPLRSGRAAVAVRRSGALVASVATRQTITSTPYVQDLQYVAAGSLREGPADASLIGGAPTPTPTVTPTPTPTPTVTPPTPTSTPTPTPTPPTPTPTVTPPTPTPTDTSGQLVTTVSPVGDTFGNAGAPTTNYGSDSSLSSRGTPGSSAFLRFAFPATPQGTELSAATLSWRTTSDAVATSADTHTVRLGNDSWEESTLNWNNEPAVGSVTVGTISGAASLNTPYTTSLSAPALRATVPASGGSETLTISSSGSDGLYLWSRHAATATYRPTLTLVYSPVAVDRTPPSAPGGPAVTVTHDAVSLSWVAATDNVGVTGYEVHRSSTPFTPGTATLVATTTALSYADAARPAGTWYYAVLAVDAADNHSSASTVQATVLDSTPPSTPVISAIASGHDVAVGWPASTDDVGVLSYEIYRGSTASAPDASSLVATVSVPGYVDAARPVGTWVYTVVALDAAGNRSAAAASASATVLDTTPPTAPSVTAVANQDAVTVSWTGSTDDVAVAAYEVYRAASAIAPVSWSLIATTTSSSTVDPGRPVGTGYYAVVALDAAGNRSIQSAVASAQVLDVAPPSVPVVTAVASGSTVTLTWPAVSDNVGVVGYDVSRLAGTVMASLGTVAGTTYVNLPVGDGSWLYLVRARDAAGNVSAAGSVTVVVSTPVVRTLTPVADTWANAGSTTTSYGTTTSIQTRGTVAAVSYLRFSIPATPAGHTLASATLTVRTTTATSAGSGYTQSFRITSDSWTEKGLTWANRPTTTGTVLGTLTGATTINRAYAVTLNGTALAGARSATGTVSLAVTCGGNDVLTLWSAQSATASYRPTLVLRYI